MVCRTLGKHNMRLPNAGLCASKHKNTFYCCKLGNL